MRKHTWHLGSDGIKPSYQPVETLGVMNITEPLPGAYMWKWKLLGGTSLRAAVSLVSGKHGEACEMHVHPAL